MTDMMKEKEQETFLGRYIFTRFCTSVFCFLFAVSFSLEARREEMRHAGEQCLHRGKQCKEASS